MEEVKFNADAMVAGLSETELFELSLAITARGKPTIFRSHIGGTN